jgi:Tfp pilus assembly protein PilP
MVNRFLALIWAAVACLTGCGREAPPIIASGPGEAVRARHAAGEPEAMSSSPLVPPVTSESPVAYESRTRRDPFRLPSETASPAEPGEQPALASLRLVGIIRSTAGPIALVEGSDGLGVIVRPGDLLGNARVAEIARDSVRLKPAGSHGKEGAASAILRLSPDESQRDSPRIRSQPRGTHHPD